ncbi:MAG: SDR family oxidoreductase [Acidobacteriia bacterium]|nr:SDR family oxidoreductase [Terriglobia bacterium]
MKFKDRVVLVTGASKGIGRAIALEFGREGAHLALVARSRELLDRLRDELQNTGREALALPCDVTDRAAFEAAIRRTIETFGGLDVLVNNAGMGMYSPLATMPMNDFDRLVSLNVHAVLYSIQAALPQFEKQGHGHIINVSSILGRLDYPWMGAYCATKHAVNSISNALRMELRDKNIEVMTVCPGRVLTDFQDNAIKYKEVENPSKPTLPMSPEAVARAVVRAAWKHRREVVLPRAAWVMIALQQFWPALADRVALSWSSR